MKPFSKRTVLILITVVVMSAALLVGVNYTDACRLQQVTLNDTPLENWQSKLVLDANRSVLRQPADSLAQLMMKASDVFKVDISYELPDRIEIRTNNFEPVCFVVDAGSGRLLGLTKDARVVSLKNAEYNFEHPVLTSVSAGPLFGFCKDIRVSVIVEHLEMIREDNIVLYRLIDEIDFGFESFVQVTLTGLPYRLKVRAENFRDQMQGFVEFVSRFAPDLNGVGMVDMRFDNMIICDGGKR